MEDLKDVGEEREVRNLIEHARRSMEYKVCSYPDLKIFMAHTNGIQRTPVHN